MVNKKLLICQFVGSYLMVMTFIAAYNITTYLRDED